MDKDRWGPGGSTHRAARDRLFSGIVGTAGLLGLGYLALYLVWGSGPVLAEVPWFNALAFVCQLLAASTVAFLAFGRHRVLSGSVACWIGRGFAGYSILVLFHVLTWPGLLPARILAPHPNSSGWLVLLAWSLLAGSLLADDSCFRPAVAAREAEAGEGYGSLAPWLGAVTLLGLLAVVGDPLLPALVMPAGDWIVPTRAWQALLALAYAVGVVRSVRRYRIFGDPLAGYVALAQLVLAYGIGGMLLGGKRYDLWWYLARLLGVGGFVTMMGGLLAEYVTLFRREQAKAGELQAQAAALQQAEAALQQANTTLEARVRDRTAALQEANRKLELACAQAEDANIHLEEINAQLQKKVEERQRAETLLAEANAALRESEARYRGLVELAPDAVLVHQDWQIVYANAAAVRLYGAVSFEQLRGRHRLDMIHPDDRGVVRARVQQVRAGSTMPLRELRHLRLDGREMSVEATATPVEWQGKPAVQVIVRDITGRKQAEQALQQAYGELEQRVQERTAELFQVVQQLERKSAQLRALASELTQAEERERERLAMLLHDDLQQLLIGMKLVMSPLAQAGDPRVRAVGHEMSDLLKQALHCSRSLTEELSPPILHMSGLAPALNWLANWMKEKYHLTVAVRASGPILLESHETAVLLFRAIRELLFNTAKHAQTKSATVEIAQRDDLVRACVSDAGVGFDPSKLRMAGGTAGGVGLFNIRERLVYLGGGLEVESAPEKGSRFTLWLPLPRAVPPTDAVASGVLEETQISALEAERAGPAGAGARKIRLLVVDDHSVVRQGLVRLLTEAPDIEVVGDAADGQSAIALAADLLPDVITMDVNMPGLDGVEATRRIHAAAPVIQIIGLSVHEEATQATLMRAAGAVNYLTKSAPAEDLLAIIRACGRSSR